MSIPGPSWVLSAAACGIVDAIRKAGGDPDVILGRAGLNTDRISGALQSLPLLNYCRLFEEAAHLMHAPAFGLHFGQGFKPRDLGLLGCLAITAPTLKAAIDKMRRYFGAHQSQTHFGMYAEEDLLWLSYSIYDPRIGARRQDAELSLGMFANIVREACGRRWSPAEVRFEHPRPECADEHERSFACRVQFDRRTNALGLIPEDLEQTMPAHDPVLHALIEQVLADRRARLPRADDFAAVAAGHIRMLLGSEAANAASVAKRMGLSEQQLRRRLRAQNLSFHGLLKAARKSLALHFLRQTDIPLTEISMLLGYSEISAFSRAFRLWTGISPLNYRNQMTRSPGPGADDQLLLPLP